jgi:hypothetical protein
MRLTSSRFRRLRASLVVALAGVAGIAAFARSLVFDFVYDDHWTVEGMPRDVPLGRALVALARGAGHELHIPDETRPSMVLSVWTDRALFGTSPLGYHAHSVLLYAGVSALAAWTCLALDGRRRVAIVAGLLFALAPLHAEVACAINYREDLIASAGVLVPLVCLVRRPPNPRWLEVIAVISLALGLFGKESAVAFVLLVAAAVAIVPRLRARVLARKRLLLALGIVLAAWSIWRGVLMASGDDIPRVAYAGIVARLLATARYCVRVGVATLLPVHPSPEYAREPPASAAWLVPLAAWVLTAWVLARRRITRTPALGLAIVLLAPLPASPLIGPSNEVADRYAFLGVLGAAPGPTP